MRGTKHGLAEPKAGPSRDLCAAPRDRGILIGAALVALAILAAYGNSLSGPFFFDDPDSIHGNPTIHHLWAIGSVLSPPGHGEAVQNRPVVNLSLAINYALGGEQVFGYHLFNLGVHILAALALLGIVRRTLLLPAFADRLGKSATRYATAIALLWGLHPLGTEAVTYVIQRTESMFSMFYLLTLYCCIRGYGAARPKRWFTAAAGSCLLGMGCKEAMVTAPLMVLLYDRVFVARAWKEVFQRRWGLYAGLAATWLLLGLILARSSGTRGTGAGFGVGMTSWEYARTQFWAICHYLRLSFWPSGLVVDYGEWIASAPGEYVPYAFAVILLILATLAAYARWPWAGYLGTWFFVVLSPSSSVVPLAAQTVAEKRMYLPLAAVTTLAVLMAGAAGKRLADRMARPESAGRRRAGPLAVAAVACVAMTFGFLTVLRNRDYRSELAIWDDAVRKRPDHPGAYLSRACAYENLGECDNVIADCNKAIALKPDYANAYIHRGNAFAAKGDPNQALADFSRAIELSPDLATAYNNRGLMFVRAGAFDRAVEDLTKAIALKPDLADAWRNRADAYNGLGDGRRALADYSRVIEFHPDSADAYVNRGNAYRTTGDNEQALADYSRAIELNPGLADAYNNRGALYLVVGVFDRAVQDFTKAIELRPNYVNAYSNRAMVFYYLKDYDRAWADVKALEKLGGKPSAHLLQLLTQAGAAATSQSGTHP